MKANPVCWFEIYVNDMSRARKFYQAVLKTELSTMSPPGGDLEMCGFPGDMTTMGSSGALVKMEGCSAGGNSTIVYFSCDDCTTEEKRVVPAGGKVMKTKFPIGEYGFIALVEDTEGNVFGLHSMK